MNNFEFYNPVHVVFGKETIKELANLIPANQNILMIYGGGSIKRNGVYDQVKTALANHMVIEFSGIEPNPTYETCMKAVEIVKKENIDFLLSVGGGSALDGTKFIAAASKFDAGDPWDILAAGAEIKDALPLGCVLTLPATGSEMNANSVISHVEKNLKLPFTNAKVYPTFSILDPEATYSLPEKQTINGVVDAFVHVMEQYMTYDVNTPLQDRQAEAILATLIEEGPKVLEDPNDYDSRANIMWTATHALNGIICCGTVQDWATHMIGHELTAIYGIDHAQSLAIVMPSLWRHQKESKLNKLAQYGKRIFGITETDSNKAAEQAISMTEDFFHSINMPTTLQDYNINSKDAAEKVKQRFEERNVAFGENLDINGQAAYEILVNC